MNFREVLIQKICKMLDVSRLAAEVTVDESFKELTCSICAESPVICSRHKLADEWADNYSYEKKKHDICENSRACISCGEIIEPNYGICFDCHNTSKLDNEGWTTARLKRSIKEPVKECDCWQPEHKAEYCQPELDIHVNPHRGCVLR